MAGFIVDIRGLHESIDGSYEIDDELTFRDFRTIKRVTGLRANEVQDGLDAGDTDLIVAFGMIALDQNGKPFDEAWLWRGTSGSIKLRDPDKPDQQATPDPTTLEPPKDAGEPSSEISGGALKPTGGDSPETEHPNGSGDPDSPLLASEPATWEG